MFNIGFGELLVIGFLALIFIHPKHLPEIAQVVGRLAAQLKRISEDALGSFSDFKHKTNHFFEKQDLVNLKLEKNKESKTQQSNEAQTREVPLQKEINKNEFRNFN